MSSAAVLYEFNDFRKRLPNIERRDIQWPFSSRFYLFCEGFFNCFIYTISLRCIQTINDYVSGNISKVPVLKEYYLKCRLWKVSICEHQGKIYLGNNNSQIIRHLHSVLSGRACNFVKFLYFYIPCPFRTLANMTTQNFLDLSKVVFVISPNPCPVMLLHRLLK